MHVGLRLGLEHDLGFGLEHVGLRLAQAISLFGITSMCLGMID